MSPDYALDFELDSDDELLRELESGYPRCPRIFFSYMVNDSSGGPKVEGTNVHNAVLDWQHAIES